MVTGDSQQARKLLDKIKNDDFDVHSDFGSVINLLRSDSEDARRDAALCFEKLAERYPTDAISRKSHVIQCLEDDATAVRAVALSALKNLAEKNPGSVREEIPDIINRVQDKPYVKKSALETTLVIAEEYPDDIRGHIPELIDAIKGEGEGGDERMRELAAETVVRASGDGESDIELLREAAESLDGDSKGIIQERIDEIQQDGDSDTDGDGDDSERWWDNGDLYIDFEGRIREIMKDMVTSPGTYDETVASTLQEYDSIAGIHTQEEFEAFHTALQAVALHEDFTARSESHRRRIMRELEDRRDEIREKDEDNEDGEDGEDGDGEYDGFDVKPSDPKYDGHAVRYDNSNMSVDFDGKTRDLVEDMIDGLVSPPGAFDKNAALVSKVLGEYSSIAVVHTEGEYEAFVTALEAVTLHAEYSRRCEDYRRRTLQECEERRYEIRDDDDDDDGEDDEGEMAYQEASSTELPEDYAFEDKVNRNDYFRCSLDAVDEGIRFTLALVGEEKRRRNYCRAISSDEVYVPVSIFAALGLHDNQIDWLGSNGRQEVILGILERSSIQPEVPESEEIEDSQLNPSAKGSGEGFNVKIDLEGGDEPEAMYLDIVKMEGYLGISATPVELDDTARDLPNVSANTASAENTLQFRIPLPIGYALSLTRETEFKWFTQDGSLLLVFADEISTDSEAPDTDEKDGTEPSNYEDIDGFLADIQYKTLPFQREIIRKKVSNPDLGPENIVESPEVEVPEKVVKETLNGYKEIIQHFASGEVDKKSEDDVTDGREETYDVDTDSLSSDNGDSEKDTTKEKLLNAIEEVSEELDKRPTMAEVEVRTPYSQSEYYEHFGNWTTALEKAGYEPPGKKVDEPSEEELLEAIEEVGQEVGKRPRVTDMKNVSSYDWSDYKRVFDDWTAALEKAGYEYEPHNTKTEEADGVAEETDREKNWRVLEFSKDDIKIKEIVEKPLTEGEKEVTIEDIDRSSFPINDLNLLVRNVEVDAGSEVRLHFEPTSETESDDEYLLYFTGDGAELRETREKVFGEGQKEVTIEEITWGKEPTDSIDMWVSSIKLDGDNPITPVLELSSIQKETE